MANGTTLYSGHVAIAEEDLLLLIKTADALDEIGATPQAQAIRHITSQLTRTRSRHEA